MGKHITVLVSNDLQHDQRVAKVCATLLEMGFRITLVGRLLPDSKPFERPYETRRFRLPFHTGALFYTALNVRLFFYLLFKRTDIIVANDLDTLLPAFLIARMKGKELVYDSHEYFTEAEGLTNRPFPKKVWLAVESFIFPKLKHVITVNETIAGIYRALYHVPVHVVRNVPPLRNEVVHASRESLGLQPISELFFCKVLTSTPIVGVWNLRSAWSFFLLHCCSLLALVAIFTTSNAS